MISRNEAIRVALTCIGFSEDKIRNHQYHGMDFDEAEKIRKAQLEEFVQTKIVLRELRD